MLKLSGNTEKERGAIKTNRLLAKNDAVPNSVQKSPSRDRSYLCRSQSRVEGVESLRCSRRCSAKIDYGQKRLTNSQQAGNGSGWRCICSFLAISPYKVAHINKYSQMHCGTVSIVRVLVWAKDWDRASACSIFASQSSCSGQRTIVVLQQRQLEHRQLASSTINIFNNQLMRKGNEKST